MHNLAEGWMKSLRRHDGTYIALAGHWRTLNSCPRTVSGSTMPYPLLNGLVATDRPPPSFPA